MKKRRFMFFTILAIGLVFALGDLSSSVAQESASEEFTLEEITVTAQKREENQQKVPIAMDVISGEDMKEYGKNDIAEILNNVSNVIINQAEDGLRVSIRGMSNDNAPFGGMQVSTPTVAVNKDGVYTNRNSGNTDMFDVERVEVLFGPQSTMYASASPGGIVNVVTANPKTDRYEASGSLEYGNYNLLKTEGSMNAPLSDMMALRAAFSTNVRDGYLTNGGMDEDSKAARIRALFQPSDSVSLIITGEITNAGGQGFANVVQFVDQDDIDNPWTATSDTPGNATMRVQKKAYANMDFGLGDFGTLSVVASYSKTTNDRSGTETSDPDGPGPAQASESQVTASGYGDEKGVEARMASGADAPLKWILGVNYYKTSDNQSQIQVYGGTVEDNIGNRWNKQTTKAVYGNVTYPITDRFRATAGARQTWDQNTSYNWQYPGKPPNQTEPTIEGTDMEYNDPNFKVGVEYDISDNSMLYGDWSTSYRTQSAGTKGAEFAPEELSAYTVGAKNRFFGNKVQLNASAYYYDYKNYFAVIGPMMTIVDENNNGVRDFDDANGNGVKDEGEGWTENGMQEDLGNLTTGDARIYGFDIQTTTILSSRDKIEFNLSYIKKEFTDLEFIYYPITNSLGVPNVSYNGKEMPNAPNVTANINYSHNFPLPNGGTITPRVEARYSSKYVLNWQAWEYGLDRATMEPYFRDTTDVRWQESYFIANLALVYANADGKWTLNGYVNNLQDYAQKRGMMMGSFMIGPPRTYGMVLSVRF